MKKAIWYHIKPSGSGINAQFATTLFAEQMALWQQSGLAAAAALNVVGVNGTEHEADRLRPYLPVNCQLFVHGNEARSELPTLHRMQAWLPPGEEWAVCYWHAKGVTHANDALCRAWRQCMERATIVRWRRCERDLQQGYDSVGAHWLTREEYGSCVNTFFWGGNFWWAKSSFLANLPRLLANSTCRDHDYQAETWIGTGARPRIRDYAPHWPNLDKCTGVKCYLL